MRVPVNVPNLGAEATEARIASWLRQVRDVFAEGEAIADETDKATRARGTEGWTTCRDSGSSPPGRVRRDHRCDASRCLTTGGYDARWLESRYRAGPG